MSLYNDYKFTPRKRIRKRVALFFCITALLFCTSAFAGQKEIVFTWQKATIEADLAGFTLYEYDADHNPTGREFIIPYTGQTDFTHSETISAPDGTETKFCYRLDAFDNSGNCSDKTPLIDDDSPQKTCIVLDFAAPGMPTQFTVTVIVVPE